MIRKRKLFVRPKKPFEAQRIKDENELKRKYALKSKREVWRTQAQVDYFRGRAKALAKMPLEEQKVLFGKLQAIGVKADTISDVLGLKVEDLLERRLTTVAAKKKIANTPRHARQLISHRKLLVDGKAVSSPSFLVPVALEGKLSVKIKTRVKKPAPAAEAVETAEVSE
jgi:small subunit ribosomal protein S4